MDIINITDTEIAQNLIQSISSLTTFIQAIGGLILIYLVFNIISFFMNKKKNKEIERINHNLIEIKNLLKKKKN